MNHTSKKKAMFIMNIQSSNRAFLKDDRNKLILNFQESSLFEIIDKAKRIFTIIYFHNF